LIALASVLLIIALSLLITHVATVALTLTGLSRQLAQFQARSAFSGVGFTTNEAEEVVSHPVRRRVIMILMLLGNAGIATVISSLILTFVTTTKLEWILRLTLLLVGLVVLWVLGTSGWIDRHLSRLISWALQRWTRLEVRDYSKLLHLSGEYEVTELQVQPGDWLADKTLAELSLHQEGVIILGIVRGDGDYVGAPQGESYVYEDDTLILYGREQSLAELDDRQRDISGDQAHQKAVAEQEQRLQEQSEQERERQIRKEKD
jgi:hypothetical protein